MVGSSVLRADLNGLIKVINGHFIFSHFDIGIPSIIIGLGKIRVRFNGFGVIKDRIRIFIFFAADIA